MFARTSSSALRACLLSIFLLQFAPVLFAISTQPEPPPPAIEMTVLEPDNPEEAYQLVTGTLTAQLQEGSRHALTEKVSTSVNAFSQLAPGIHPLLGSFWFLFTLDKIMDSLLSLYEYGDQGALSVASDFALQQVHSYWRTFSATQRLMHSAHSIAGHFSPLLTTPALITTPEYPELAAIFSVVQHMPASWNEKAPGLELNFNPALTLSDYFKYMERKPEARPLKDSTFLQRMELIQTELLKLNDTFQPRIRILARSLSPARIDKLQSDLCDLLQTGTCPLQGSSLRTLSRTDRAPRGEPVLELVLTGRQGERFIIISTRKWSHQADAQWNSVRAFHKNLIDSRNQHFRMDYQYLSGWLYNPEELQASFEKRESLSELSPEVLDEIYFILQTINAKRNDLTYTPRVNPEIVSSSATASEQPWNHEQYTPHEERVSFAKFTSPVLPEPQLRSNWPAITENKAVTHHLMQTRIQTAISHPDSGTTLVYDGISDPLNIQLYFQPFDSKHLPALATVDALRRQLHEVENKGAAYGLLHLALSESFLLWLKSPFPGDTPSGRQVPAKKKKSGKQRSSGNGGGTGSGTVSSRSGTSSNGSPRSPTGALGGGGGGKKPPKKPVSYDKEAPTSPYLSYEDEKEAAGMREEHQDQKLRMKKQIAVQNAQLEEGESLLEQQRQANEQTRAGIEKTHARSVVNGVMVEAQRKVVDDNTKKVMETDERVDQLSVSVKNQQALARSHQKSAYRTMDQNEKVLDETERKVEETAAKAFVSEVITTASARLLDESTEQTAKAVSRTEEDTQWLAARSKESRQRVTRQIESNENVVKGNQRVVERHDQWVDEQLADSIAHVGGINRKTGELSDQQDQLQQVMNQQSRRAKGIDNTLAINERKTVALVQSLESQQENTRALDQAITGRQRQFDGAVATVDRNVQYSKDGAVKTKKVLREVASLEKKLPVVEQGLQEVKDSLASFRKELDEREQELKTTDNENTLRGLREDFTELDEKFTVLEAEYSQSHRRTQKSLDQQKDAQGKLEKRVAAQESKAGMHQEKIERLERNEYKGSLDNLRNRLATLELQVEVLQDKPHLRKREAAPFSRFRSRPEGSEHSDSLPENRPVQTESASTQTQQTPSSSPTLKALAAGLAGGAVGGVAISQILAQQKKNQPALYNLTVRNYLQALMVKPERTKEAQASRQFQSLMISLVKDQALPSPRKHCLGEDCIWEYLSDTRYTVRQWLDQVGLPEDHQRLQDSLTIAMTISTFVISVNPTASGYWEEKMWVAIYEMGLYERNQGGYFMAIQSFEENLNQVLASASIDQEVAQTLKRWLDQASQIQ
ncbi:hypothetical protein [Endozoicomonas arenosclerae]|uniref:hypothetical protein n=1 Tax=Endozoicomonas arenosclerae TaxID=1633495 RepID=UPI0007804274|nr:hypothetical protein [Endozoicomonas arenosclerae]